MDLKDIYTSVFLKAAGLPDDEESVKKNKLLWWYNLRSKSVGGLRLTDQGLKFIKDSEIRVYTISFPKEIMLHPQLLIWLDNQIESPYHITRRNISVIKERAALEIYLFAGDIKKMGYAKSMAKRLNT